MSDATNKTKVVLYAGLRLTVALAWFDLWIGFYVDPAAGILYWCPLPCVVVAYRYRLTRPPDPPGARVLSSLPADAELIVAAAKIHRVLSRWRDRDPESYRAYLEQEMKKEGLK